MRPISTSVVIDCNEEEAVLSQVIGKLKCLSSSPPAYTNITPFAPLETIRIRLSVEV